LKLCALNGEPAGFLNQPQRYKLIFSKKVRCHGVVRCTKEWPDVDLFYRNVLMVVYTISLEIIYFIAFAHWFMGVGADALNETWCVINFYYF